MVVIVLSLIGIVHERLVMIHVICSTLRVSIRSRCLSCGLGILTIVVYVMIAIAHS